MELNICNITILHIIYNIILTGGRVSKIQSYTDPTAWKWVESKEDLADCLTRGAKPEALGPNGKWQNGAPWMEDQIANWPVKEPILTKEMMQAMEKFYRKIPISLTSATTFVACKNTVELVPTSQAFSFLRKARSTPRQTILPGNFYRTRRRRRDSRTNLQIVYNLRQSQQVIKCRSVYSEVGVPRQSSKFSTRECAAGRR